MNRIFASFLMLFAVSSSLPALAADVADHVGAGPAPVEGMQMSPVISQEEFSRIQATMPNQPPSEPTNSWAYLWYCVAQSTVTGNWYYWYSYNGWYARNQALAACVSVNGYTCVVGCR